MTERPHFKGTDWLGLVSLGFFLIVIGAVFVVTPNLTGEIKAFFTEENFDQKPIYPNVWLPAPKTHNPKIYEAITNFCYAFGASQIILLILRFALKDSSSHKAETASGIVFWLGMGFFANFANSLLVEPTSWFSLLSGLILMIGLLIISRILLAELLRRL